MPDALVRIVLQGDEAVAGADRVSQALGRMERSEPTRALRQTRTAIDELANAATGLNPALGRVVSTLAQFSIGGAVGLGVVGGLAAIGVEIKSLLNTVPNLERAFGKLNDEFAHMGGPGATGFANLRALTQRLEDVQEGDWFTQGIGMLRAIGGGKKGQGALGRYEDIADIEAGTESATLRNEINRQHADVTKLHTDALKKHTEELAKTRQQQHISGSVPTTALERIGADLYRRAAFGQGGNLPALSGVTEAGTTAMDNTMRGATEAATRVATSRWDPGPP